MKGEFSSAIGGVHTDAPPPPPATRRVVCGPNLYDGRYTGSWANGTRQAGHEGRLATRSLHTACMPEASRIGGVLLSVSLSGNVT